MDRLRTRDTVTIAAILIIIVVAIIGGPYDTYPEEESPYPDDSDDDPIIEPEVPSEPTELDYELFGPYAQQFDIVETQNGYGMELDISLKSTIVNEYADFQWFIIGMEDETQPGLNAMGTGITWTLTEDVRGLYEIMVICYVDETDKSKPHSTLDKLMVSAYIGQVERYYSWNYEGHRYQFSIEYDYSDYLAIAGTNGASIYLRSLHDCTDYPLATKFLKSDETTITMENELSELYSDVYGTPEGQGYAEFVLHFIQTCFSYYYDEEFYKQYEYYAFPLETIHYGGGDCEDTAILYTMLMEAAGYETGLIRFPDHMVSAIVLDDYVASDLPLYEKDTLNNITITSNGEKYVACESTENGYSIGWIWNDYDVTPEGDVIFEGEVFDESYEMGLYKTPESK